MDKENEQAWRQSVIKTIDSLALAVSAINDFQKEDNKAISSLSILIKALANDINDLKLRIDKLEGKAQ